MPEIDEFEKRAEDALVDINFFSQENYKDCVKAVAKALREVHERAVDECAKISVLIEADPDEDKDAIRAKCSSDIHDKIRQLKYTERHG